MPNTEPASPAPSSLACGTRIAINRWNRQPLTGPVRGLAECQPGHALASHGPPRRRPNSAVALRVKPTPRVVGARMRWLAESQTACLMRSRLDKQCAVLRSLLRRQSQFTDDDRTDEQQPKRIWQGRAHRFLNVCCHHAPTESIKRLWERSPARRRPSAEPQLERRVAVAESVS